MFKLMQRIRDEDEGFTLIELMVVVLIIAILIAIAIPTFLGARERAQDRAAQSDMRNALTAAKTLFVDHSAYLGGNVTDKTEFISALEGIEPSVTFSATASTVADNEVFVVDVDASTVTLRVMSSAGNCFQLVDRALPGETEPAGTVGPEPVAATECAAA